MKERRKAQNKDDHNLASKDLLSRLPDDILVSILSTLPLNDAAVTSLLSRRWRYLWCKRDCLVFDRKGLKHHSFNVPVMEIKFLNALIFNFIDVNDEDLKKILSNCPILEYLYIFRSRKLVKAEIRGKGLALTNLDMIDCLGLESVEICDSNIVSFSCTSSPISLRFDNLQKLEKICISTEGHSWEKINDMFRQISCGVPYLKVLSLTFDLYCLQGAIEPFSLIPKLPQLKQLTIRVIEWDNNDLLPLPSLVLEVFPNLQSLKIMNNTGFIVQMTHREARQMAKKPHQHLEVVEIGGYHWRTDDLELAMYFFQNCVALKEFVIKPSKIPRNETMEYVNGARYGYHTQQHLETITPVGVKLVIL